MFCFLGHLIINLLVALRSIMKTIYKRGWEERLVSYVPLEFFPQTGKVKLIFVVVEGKIDVWKTW